MDIKIKRHYRVLLVFIFTILFFGLVLGNTMVVPYSSGNQLTVDSDPNNIGNDVYIFDDSVIHEIQVSMSEEDYQSMITTFNETGEKEYFPADVKIDGVTIKNVGLRLKGNSSLNGIFKRNTADNKSIQAPYLIKFNEYVDGQSYQGYEEIAVRTGSFNGNGVALLEEPLSLFIYESNGQIAPEYSYASVTIASSEPFYYVICENIDENYIEKHFGDDDGVLYKKGNSTDFSYNGEDQSKYVEEYDQEMNENDEDYSKLIAFLKFVSESSDQEFGEGLPNWLKLDSFITLMALNDLIDNQDSFASQGRNFYLYYNPKTEQFQMLAWDFNLAFGGFGGNRGMMSREGNMSPQIPQDMPQMDFNASRQVYPNRDTNRSAMRPEGMPNMDFNMSTQRPEGMGGFRQGTNELKERFFANEKFSQMYEERYEELSKKLYCDDSLLEKIDYIAKVFTEYNKENNILDQSSYDVEVQKMIEYVKEKKESFCD